MLTNIYHRLKSISITDRNIINISIIYVTFLILTSFIVKAGMYSDAAWGFDTLNSMLNGGDFNYQTIVNPDDISTDINVFSNTWTPGQYVFSYLLIKYLNLDIGVSIFFIVTLCTCIGIIGFYLLFTKLNLPKNLTLISLLIIISQRYFALPFSIYNGGEVILFGFLPWLVLLIKYNSYTTYKGFFLFIFLGLFGFFIKTSFLITFVALCLYAFLNSNDFNPKNRFKIIVNGLFLIVIIMITVAICYYGFLNKGIYSEQKFNFKFNLSNSFYVLSSLWNSALSLDDLFNKIFLYPGNNYSSNTITLATLIWNIVLAIFSLITIKKIYDLKEFKEIRILCMSFFIVFISVFLCLYNKEQITSSLEMRHFRPLGLLCIPLIIHLTMNAKNKYLYIILTGTIILSAIYGPISYIQRELYIYKENSIGRQNFSHGIIDQQTLSQLIKIDLKADKNTLIYVPSPEIALEIKNARKIIAHVDFTSAESLRNAKYNGKVDILYLCLQKKFEFNGKQNAIIESFKNYANHKVIFTNSKFNIIQMIN